MKKRNLAILFLLILVTLNLFSLNAEAESGDEKVVKIGYIDYAGFIELDENQEYTGYGVEYLEKIAEYTGYHYEYVYGQWSELMDKLRSHEIDFLCIAQYTKERDEEFDFSAYPIGYTQGLIYAPLDTSISYEDFTAFDGMTFGVMRDNAMNDLFLKYAEDNGFSCSLIEYSTDALLLQAMENGEVDAICSEHLANHSSLSLIGNFGADAYYMMSYADSPYIPEVNYALQEIKTDVDFETQLYHKYYDSSAAESTIQFTTEEKEYIQNAPVLKVGLMPNRSPLSYSDEQGEPAGMLVDLMKLISQKSGLEFQYEFMDIGQTGYDYLTNSGGDLVAGVASSAFSKPNPALLVSNTIQLDSIVFVGRDGMDFDAESSFTVAIPAGFINGEQVVSQEYPNAQFYFGISNEDCLEAIRDGQADVMLQNMYIIRECLQSPYYDGLEIFPAYTFDENEKVVSLPENEILISVINKAIQTITADQANDIVISNTIAKDYDPSLSETVYKYKVPLIGISLLLLIVIGMIMAIAIMKQRSFVAVETMNHQLENSNKQLEEAVAQADRASTAKSRFLSQMSHEIRTPMNAIVGLTAIAKKYEGDAEKTDHYLEKIETASKVLLSIINDVLDMSAIESNKLKIADEEFEIQSILTGISTIYSAQCESKGIKFEMNTDIADTVLRGDSLRVNQILLNLISNSFKFTEKGGLIHVSACETARKEDNAFIRFIVQDTGSGMTQDMKERLFKPFEQETASTAKKHGGSGLGMSITKNLVDMMHGAISVESEKGKGTKFTVDIPFKIGDAQNDNKSVNGESNDTSQMNSPAKKGYDFHDARILLAEDNELNAEIAMELLHSVHLQVDYVMNGQSAVEQFQKMPEGTYQVILMDIQMPLMDGYEATKAIRELNRTDAGIIPIIAMTANAFAEDVAQAISAGMNGHIAKPIDTGDLYRTLARYIK